MMLKEFGKIRDLIIKYTKAESPARKDLLNQLFSIEQELRLLKEEKEK